MDKISVVVPVYKSQEILPELFRQVDDALRDFEYELILVNDGSPDGSWDEIRKLTEKSPCVIGVNLRKNSGQDNALIAGLEQAKGDYVVIMDDDLQHSPYDIPLLYEACKKGFDICYANFEVKEQKSWKNLGSWFNSKLSEALLRKLEHIYLSPFKIFRGELLRTLLKFHYPFPYVDGMLLSITDHVTQIDVAHHKRFSGDSTYSLTKSISVFMKHLSSFSVLPLRISIVLGFLVSSLGFLYGLYIFCRYLVVGLEVEGWTSLAMLVLILGGVNLLAIGIIGEYLGRTYLTINNRPTFSIKEVVYGSQRRRAETPVSR